MTTTETTHYVFGEGKLAVAIEAETEKSACEQYVKLVESKGNENFWDFNMEYKKAKKFLLNN